jgi:hypothetical protein
MQTRLLLGFLFTAALVLAVGGWTLQGARRLVTA